MGFNKQKLKVNLKLAINRLKLMEKKKTELALKSRKEIADYISNGKDDRAKIRVEHIIREDYLVEAMELVEMYCDLLLARFGLIETSKFVEEGLEEAICSIIWVAPRLSTDIQELKIVSDQMFMKYGKPYCLAARADEHDKVSERLKVKMSYKPPPKLLVERYLIEIAKSHNIPYEPDPTVLNPADVEALLIDTDESALTKPPGGGSSGGGGGMQQPMPPQTYSYAPPPQQPPIGFAGSQPPIQGGFPAGASGPYPNTPAPPYTPNDPAYPPPLLPSAPTKSTSAPSFPELPSVPNSSFPPLDDVGTGSAGGEDVDFDDLTKRFEELKKKK